MASDSELLWEQPFSEDPDIRNGEESMTKINSLFFIPNKTIFLADDDHLRLTAIDCENLEFPRKK